MSTLTSIFGLLPLLLFTLILLPSLLRLDPAELQRWADARLPQIVPRSLIGL